MALQPNTPSRYVKAIRYESMTDLLTHFRQTLERENNQSIQELDNVNAAMLYPICVSFLACRTRIAERSWARQQQHGSIRSLSRKRDRPSNIRTLKPVHECLDGRQRSEP